MRLYLFSSDNVTYIWTAVGAGTWAVPRSYFENPSIVGKAANLPRGVLGLFYCVQTGSFTTPFVVLSKPDTSHRALEVWADSDGAFLPFRIAPFGTPRRQFPTARLSELPVFSQSGRQWTHVFHISPATAFAASEVDDQDWDYLVCQLAEAEPSATADGGGT